MKIVQNHGVRNITLSTGYGSELIKEYFQDGINFGAKIKYAHEKEPLGTAGPLFLADKPKKPFLMINGDNLFDLDIKKMTAFFKNNDALGVIALTPVNDSLKGGSVKMEGNNIVKFCEKLPPEIAKKEIGEPPYWLNSGYCLLSPKIFNYLPKKQNLQ